MRCSYQPTVVPHARINANTSIVRTMDTRMEPRQPSRLEKKKNMLRRTPACGMPEA